MSLYSAETPYTHVEGLYLLASSVLHVHVFAASLCDLPSPSPLAIYYNHTLACVQPLHTPLCSFLLSLARKYGHVNDLVCNLHNFEQEDY